MIRTRTRWIATLGSFPSSEPGISTLVRVSLIRACSLALLITGIAAPYDAKAYDVCSDDYASNGVNSCAHEKMFDEALMIYEHLAPGSRFKDEILANTNSIRAGVGAPDEEDPLYDNGSLQKTTSHFWEPDDSYGQPMVWGTDPYPNAFNASQALWTRALGEYAAENTSEAYRFLGMIAHYLGDQTVPAHANGDTHPEQFNDADPFEEYMSNPLLSKTTLTSDERALLEAQGLVVLPDYETNEKLLWLFLNVNQVGGFFGSDDNEGDANAPYDSRYPYAAGWADQAIADVTTACDGNCPTTSDRLQNNDKNTYPYYYDENSGGDNDLSLIRTHSYVPGVRMLAALFTLWEESIKLPIMTLSVQQISQTGETDNFGCELDPLSPDGTSGLDGCNNPDLYVAIVMGSRRENTPPGTRLESDDDAHTYRSQSAGVVDMDYANVTRKDSDTSVAEDRRTVNAKYHFGQAFKPDPISGEFSAGERIKISLQVHDADDNPILAPYEDDDIAFVHVNGSDTLEIYVDLAKCINRSADGIEIYNYKVAKCAASTANSADTIFTGGGRADYGEDPDEDFGEDPEDVDVKFSVSMFVPDLEPPVITCNPPAVEWSDTDVSRACTAVDDGSGLANANDASFELWTSEPADSETNNALTDTREVCDMVGNCATVGPLDGNKVDKKAPVISIVQPTASEYTHSETLMLDYTVTDGGSGVDTVSPSMDGNSTVAGNGLPSGQAILLLISLPLGEHNFAVDADDEVDNVSPTASVTFSIIVTPESLIEAVTIFEDLGELDPKLVKPLLAKLKNAAKNFNAGKCTPAGNIYGAFINQVQAKSGKGITPFAAEILIADAQYLISNC